MKLRYLALLPVLLAGCAGPDVQQYNRRNRRWTWPSTSTAPPTPGACSSAGNGEVVKRFHVEITGTSDVDKLTLDERFRYDDGSTQPRLASARRRWPWRGTAADVKGEAMGEVPATRCAGNTRCCCRSTAAPTKCSSTTGCS
jgi:hypothetical protein